ncbi:MAG: acetyl-CoA carboxylase biotin carboxyl carrier protein subunit [Oscillospiraceae bacterium]|nr:acetyl-CoA carboxylase biotin carboxyl carrier protein subunit [Oscillospiraceae bacterium]
MREFLITVNGKTYEVQVEETAAKTAPKPAPVPAAPAAASEPASSPEVKAPPPSAKAAGKISIKSPMPGSIVNINAKVGDTVKPDTLLCILEAMKMENEIFAGVDGVIVSVDTSKGASVNSGDLLFTVN